MKNFILILLIVFALTSTTFGMEIQTSTSASDVVYTRVTYQPFFGVMGGIATSKEATRASGEFGLEAGYFPKSKLSLALEITGSQYEDIVSTTNDRTNLLIKSGYHFAEGTAFIQNSYIGLTAGTIVRSSASDFTIGPLLGFDIPFAESKSQGQYSLGANLKYLFTNATATEGVAANGVLKYWF
jgi:hypothetical protein